MNTNLNDQQIFELTQSMIEHIQHNLNITNVVNSDTFVEFNIEFHILENNSEEDDEHNYFKSFNEINKILCKPTKIKKDDNIILEDCLICMENYKMNEYKRVLPRCKHYFHKKCIDKWLKKKSSCPICRDELL
jgi:hypothetical protein